MTKYFDQGTILVIVITFILFVVALFVKGFTHDLLLEAGVFLVSVKLILMSYRSGLNHSDLNKGIQDIKRLIEETQKK